MTGRKVYFFVPKNIGDYVSFLSLYANEIVKMMKTNYLAKKARTINNWRNLSIICTISSKYNALFDAFRVICN